jgi:hypothetical protein
LQHTLLLRRHLPAQTQSNILPLHDQLIGMGGIDRILGGPGDDTFQNCEVES